MYTISLQNHSLIFGTSIDVKPVEVLEGSMFLEVDTARSFNFDSSAWVQKTTGANLVLSDITTNDVNTSRHGFFPKLPAPTGKYLKDDLTWATIAGGGDVVGPVVSVASQIALFDGITGKLIKADTTTGIVKSTAGVISAAIADTDYASVATVALKAPLASPTFTGTVSGITKSMVGLGSADNTSDASKPVSTAQQTALDLKANLISPVFTTPALGVATGTSMTTTGALTSSGGGIGYVAGAGGTVTQITSRTTTVVLNKLCGNITMFSAAQAANAIVTFTLTNSFIAATDYLLVQHISATNGGAWVFSTGRSSARRERS